MRVGVLAAAALLVSACSPPSDLGKSCRLTQPDPNNHSKQVFVEAAYFAGADGASHARFDFISNGDSECENLVCVRQAGKDFSAQDAADGNAHGICSDACLEDSDCGEKSQGLTCNRLAFDQAFLDQLKQSDPSTYQQYFGDSASATYCINPNLPAKTN